MTGIYLITNKLNGKQYVGQSKDISKRLKDHKYGSLHIDNAIKKYGIENFYIDVILECPENMLDVWEKDMISLYDTYNTDNGYKHTEGGDFRQATYRAVRQGLMQAESVLLEPYYAFVLDLPNIRQTLRGFQSLLLF